MVMVTVLIDITYVMAHLIALMAEMSLTVVSAIRSVACHNYTSLCIDIHAQVHYHMDS